MKKFFLIFVIAIVVSPVYAHSGIIGESLKAVCYICFGDDCYTYRRCYSAPRVQNNTTVYNNTNPAQVQQEQIQTSQQPINVTINTPNGSGHWENHTSPYGFTTQVWIPDTTNVVSNVKK